MDFLYCSYFKLFHWSLSLCTQPYTYTRLSKHTRQEAMTCVFARDLNLPGGVLQNPKNPPQPGTQIWVYPPSPRYVYHILYYITFVLYKMLFSRKRDWIAQSTMCIKEMQYYYLWAPSIYLWQQPSVDLLAPTVKVWQYNQYKQILAR